MKTLTAEQWPKVMLDQSCKCMMDLLDAVDFEMSKHYPPAVQNDRYYNRIQPKLDAAREAIDAAYELFGEDWPKFGGAIWKSVKDYPGRFIQDEWGAYRFVPDYRRPVLDEVLSINEAAELYGVPQDTLKHACAGQHGIPPRFTPEECRKSGRYWLVTRAGMERLYGPAKNR